MKVTATVLVALSDDAHMKLRDVAHRLVRERTASKRLRGGGVLRLRALRRLNHTPPPQTIRTSGFASW
jgi:hypothetical protein